MILVVCSNLDCQSIFRVMGDPLEVHPLVGTESEFWPNNYACPACGEKATGCLEQSVDLRGRTVRDLEVQEMFQALNGMGLPEEQKCTKAAVVDFLKMPIMKVGGHPIPNTDRFCIEWIEVGDGSRMYLAASSHGAIVYRITKPIKHTEKVLKELDVES